MSRDGLEAVLLALTPALLRFIGSRGIAPGEVEDVVQEMFVRLRTHPTGPIEEPRAYLYKMADNLVIDRRRSVDRRRKREEAWSDLNAEPGVSGSFTPNAERALASRQEIMAMDRVLGTLPERTRDIFRQFRLEDREQRAIAAEFGISLSAVEKHLQRAYRAIVAERRRLDAGPQEGLRLGAQEGRSEQHGD